MPIPAGPPLSSAPVITRECYGPAQAWWVGLVGPRAGLARACVEVEVEGVALGPRRMERLVELFTAAVPGLPLVATYSDGTDDSAALFARDGGPTLLVTADADSARLVVWAEDHLAAKAIVRAARRSLPRTTAEVGQVAIAFWRGDGPRGQVDADVRDVACPTFDSIADNYMPRVRDGLRTLAALERPDATGKIVLWHGPPGTGKTHAVRAVARTWAEQLGASVEVVIDPERLFASAHYLHEVLLSDQRVRRHARRRQPPGTAPVDEEEDDSGPKAEPLRLVLLEDAAELFSSGCRETQGFARFLNLTDGVLGQGRRVVFLLTTNEEIGRIDPALTRPGRCVQALEFEPFDAEAGAAWLAARGHAGLEPGERTLSELFAAAAAVPPTLCAAGERLGF